MSIRPISLVLPWPYGYLGVTLVGTKGVEGEGGGQIFKHFQIYSSTRGYVHKTGRKKGCLWGRASESRVRSACLKDTHSAKWYRQIVFYLLLFCFDCAFRYAWMRIETSCPRFLRNFSCEYSGGTNICPCPQQYCIG